VNPKWTPFFIWCLSVSSLLPNAGSMNMNPRGSQAPFSYRIRRYSGEVLSWINHDTHARLPIQRAFSEASFKACYELVHIKYALRMHSSFVLSWLITDCRWHDKSSKSTINLATYSAIPLPPSPPSVWSNAAVYRRTSGFFKFKWIFARPHPTLLSC
jgi:hypothetical protein